MNDTWGLRATARTDANEQIAQQRVAAAFGWEVHRFNGGRLCPIDFYASQGDHFMAVLEIKSREEYRHLVWLNVRKWMSLVRAQDGLGVPALFAYLMGDDLFYIPVGAIDGRRCHMGGRHVVERATDREPVIDVYTNEMIKI